MAAGDARRAREAAGRNGQPVGIVDRFNRRRWHELWAYCPDVAPPHVAGPTVKNAGKCRPYQDFGRSTPDRWAWVPYQPYPARIVLPADHRARYATSAGAVLIEPNVKPQRHQNKDWGFSRWQELVGLLPALPWLQIGPPNARRLAGVRFMETPDFVAALAVMSHVRAAVLPEGGLHHAAAAFGVPAVVIFGGFVAPENTGYAMHRNLFTGGTACGSRVDCAHCRQAMAAITPSDVARHLEDIL
jgi:hypothetical protein